MITNGAEFQCSREYLGLPASWVGKKLGVDRRTVYRWERGETALPADAAQLMQTWLESTARSVGMVTLKALEDNSSPLWTTPDSMSSVEGFPPSWHRLLCARVAERTNRRIEWMTPDMIGGAA